jgi:hypothetical protein
MWTCNSFQKVKEFVQIKREYIVTSAELRRAMDLKGEIQSVGLYVGRSPKEIEEGKSAEKDQWIICTKEVKPKVKA